MTHSYINPSEKVDTSKIESDNSGKSSMSDRECIYKCLDNCRQLAGLDRKQVARLCEQFNPHNPDEVNIESEYPPL